MLASLPGTVSLEGSGYLENLSLYVGKHFILPQEIYHNAYWYIQIVIFGLITANFYNLLASIVRALGDSKTPLYFLIFASILNVFLALLFIIVFHWGVPGSAVAVVLSQAISVVMCILYIKKHFPILHLKKADWIFNSQEDWKFAWEHLNVGLPMAAQFSILGIGILIIQSVCNSFGADVIAAMTAALRIEQIATLPMISLACTHLPSSGIGAGPCFSMPFATHVMLDTSCE